MVNEIIEISLYAHHETTVFYHHDQENIVLFVKMSFKRFRMVIALTRIYPRGDEWEAYEEGLLVYGAIFDELLKYGLEPVITLWSTSYFSKRIWIMEK